MCVHVCKITPECVCVNGYWWAWARGDALEVIKFLGCSDSECGFTISYLLSVTYEIWRSMMYTRSPEGATKLFCDTEFICSCCMQVCVPLSVTV